MPKEDSKSQEPTDPELLHLMTRIRRDYPRHGLKVLYTPTTLRLRDHRNKIVARVVLKDDQILVGSGDNVDLDTYMKPPHVRQALRHVYQLAWPGH